MSLTFRSKQSTHSLIEGLRGKSPSEIKKIEAKSPIYTETVGDIQAASPPLDNHSSVTPPDGISIELWSKMLGQCKNVLGLSNVDQETLVNQSMLAAQVIKRQSIERQKSSKDVGDKLQIPFETPFPGLSTSLNDPMMGKLLHNEDLLYFEQESARGT
jgi:hypothetical protein